MDKEKRAKKQLPEEEKEVPAEQGSIKELFEERQQLSDFELEKEELEDRFLRKQAEFENFRRRVQKEKTEIRQAAQAEILQELLPVLDACEKALNGLREGNATAPGLESYEQGFDLMLKELETVLERYQVTSVPGVGSEFDPNWHEAVTREVSDDYPDGQVVEEYRKGYLIGQRLLRPAQVKVAVRPD